MFSLRLCRAAVGVYWKWEIRNLGIQHYDALPPGRLRHSFLVQHSSQTHGGNQLRGLARVGPTRWSVARRLWSR